MLENTSVSLRYGDKYRNPCPSSSINDYEREGKKIIMLQGVQGMLHYLQQRGTTPTPELCGCSQGFGSSLIRIQSLMKNWIWIRSMIFSRTDPGKNWIWIPDPDTFVFFIYFMLIFSEKCCLFHFLLHFFVQNPDPGPGKLENQIRIQINSKTGSGSRQKTTDPDSKPWL